MHYPGGKGKTFQHVINLMPPHEVYIETHLGGGAVLRNKRPAAKNIGIDVDGRVLRDWSSLELDVALVHGRAEDFLATYKFNGRELAYVDPPYLPETRRRGRVYKHDYSANDHKRLLRLLVALPCMVILSGYANPLYEETLRGWNKYTYKAKTHVDVREETLWFNYQQPRELHDTRFLGDTFRHRQSAKRRLERLKAKCRAMDPIERNALARWLHEQYPNALETG